MHSEPLDLLSRNVELVAEHGELLVLLAQRLLEELARLGHPRPPLPRAAARLCSDNCRIGIGSSCGIGGQMDVLLALEEILQRALLTVAVLKELLVELECCEQQILLE